MYLNKEMGSYHVSVIDLFPCSEKKIALWFDTIYVIHIVIGFSGRQNVLYVLGLGFTIMMA